MRMERKYLSIMMTVFLVYCTTGGDSMALEIKSTAFKNDEFIPAQYTCKGRDVSPPLEWSDVPENVQSFALISDDPDAPVGTWVHWVLYDIPPETRSLPEGVKKIGTLEDGSKQGMTDFGRVGYGGPCPPPGSAHRYFFKLYALDTVLNIKPGISKEGLLRAMEGHIIEQTELMGKFKR